MTTHQIVFDKELRAAVCEWPEEPPIEASIYADEIAMGRYNKAIVNALANRIYFKLKEDELAIISKMSADGNLHWPPVIDKPYAVPEGLEIKIQCPCGKEKISGCFQQVGYCHWDERFAFLKSKGQKIKESLKKFHKGKPNKKHGVILTADAFQISDQKKEESQDDVFELLREYVGASDSERWQLARNKFRISRI